MLQNQRDESTMRFCLNRIVFLGRVLAALQGPPNKMDSIGRPKARHFAAQPCGFLGCVMMLGGQSFERRSAAGRSTGGAMVHHARHRDIVYDVELVLRANRAALLGLLWAALLACVVSSLVFDVGQWLGAW
jgi:hypothetical protein